MKVAFSIDTGEGSETITAGPAAIIMWERATKRRMSELADGVGMEDLARLCWEQLRIEGRTNVKFDDWIKTILDLNEAPAAPLDLGGPGPSHV
jgi:hypothetical protein